jgi:putative FmdB family regulatory protein
MPIYEYVCQKCGHELEALQKLTDGPLRKCPACGALRLKRLVSAPQFRLKGTGWYETDFKNGNKKRLADSGDGEVAGKSESKEAAKTEATAQEPAAKKAEKKKPAASVAAAD